MNENEITSLIAGSIVLFSIVGLAFLALYIVSFWKIFTKAGKPGWAALIPFYNLFVMFQVAGMSGWWVLSVLAVIIPFVGSLFYAGVAIYMTHRISKNFGHGVGFTLGLIFIGFVFWPILGFGSSRYAPVAKAA